jgi:hypothetical protein
VLLHGFVINPTFVAVSLGELLLFCIDLLEIRTLEKRDGQRLSQKDAPLVP